jgi:hypothetical protein
MVGVRPKLGNGSSEEDLPGNPTKEILTMCQRHPVHRHMGFDNLFSLAPCECRMGPTLEGEKVPGSA